MAKDQGFQIEEAEGRLVFRTPTFRAERGSVLHSGIYSRELTSSLAAGGVLFAAFVVLVLAGVRVTAVYVGPAVGLFVLLFYAFRKGVFYEESLVAVFDRAAGRVTVTVRRFPAREESYPLSDVRDVEKGHVVITPENPDGVAFVEKIALQHGTVIPGFGEVKEYHTVELLMAGGRRVRIFSTSDEAEAALARRRIKGFMGEDIAQKD
ncbi:MAG: hypothetical protein Kow0025_15260 [Thermodesulfovibrionales bacterium]